MGYEIEDEYQKQCKHYRWVRLCILCGAVMPENDELDIKAGAAENRITHIDINQEGKKEATL